MKRTLSVVLVLILALTSLSVSATENESENIAAEELFKSYITDIYGATDYMTYEELGTVGENTLAYGMHSEATDTFYTAVLGDWVFRKFYIAAPYKLALYIITDNTVYPLETAYSMDIITDEDLPTIAGLTQRVSARQMGTVEKAVYNYLNKNGFFSSSSYSYNFIGEIDDDGLLCVVKAQTNDYDYSEVIGDYQVFSEPNPWLFAKGTQLFVVGDLELNDNAVWSLKDACDNEIVTMEEVKALCEKENVSGVHIAPYIPDTEPTSEVPASSETEPASSEATSESEVAPVEKTPKLSAKTASLNAGKTITLKVTDGTANTWLSSETSVATVKNGKITALKKGTAMVYALLKDGRYLSCKVSVKTSPKLSKSSVTVNKGKTVKVKISGKVQSINNKYTSTKIAKIIAKKNDTTIKVKGLKKGITNLKVTVNGKKLILKVTVK